MEQIHADNQASLSQISRTVHQAAAPMLLSGEGCQDMVVMSVETYENLMLQMDLEVKLMESEVREEYDDRTYTPEEVFAEMREITGGGSAA